jgi:hypothetical protein
MTVPRKSSGNFSPYVSFQSGPSHSPSRWEMELNYEAHYVATVASGRQGLEPYPRIIFFMLRYSDVCTPLKKNSVVCVRDRTIPTERPPLVGEVTANVYR